jgi:hypothetical protein
VNVDLQHVLWRTRGRYWDYSFVLRPNFLSVSSWYDFHVKTFFGLAPNSVPQTRGGVLRQDSLEMPFIATTFEDKSHKDSSGRPAGHYLVWFPPQCTDLGEAIEMPAAWGAQIVASLIDTYDQTFDLTMEELKSDGNAAIAKSFSLARERGSLVRLTGDLARFDLEMSIKVDTPAEPNTGRVESLPSPNSANRAHVLEHAIVEGEAYALGFRGHFGTLRASLTSADEIPARLARSFGGASSDEFIRNRIRGIRSRIANTSLPREPRKGFDAVVETIQSFHLDPHLGFDEYMAWIAHLLSASRDDMVVRNIAARLVKLAERKGGEN